LTAPARSGSVGRVTRTAAHPPEAAAPAGEPLRYDAFISYSRRFDARLAPALQSGLQRFAKPWYRLRALRVFRDDASLAANPGLWPSITRALETSRTFLLLASEGARDSPWVARELSHWLERRPGEPLLIALTEGEIAWDAARRDFDWERTTALPRVLGGAFADEPRWVDLRWASTGEHLSLSDPRFRGAVADLAAPLHGRDKDDLISDEVTQHRRAVRLAWSAVTTLTVLTIVAAVAAVLAVAGRHAARVQRDRATAQARLATSRQLAAESAVAGRQGDAGLALALATEGLNIESGLETRSALLAAMKALPRVQRFTRVPGGGLATISADGRTLARVTAGAVQLRPVTGGPGRRLPFHGSAIGLGVNRAGSAAAVGDAAGIVTVFGPDGRTARLRAATGPIGEEGPFPGTSIAFSPHGLVAVNGIQVGVWNGRRLRRLPVPGGPAPGDWQLAFNADGRRLAAASDSVGTVAVWRLAADGAPRGAPTVFHAGAGTGYLSFGPGVQSLGFSPTDPRRLVIGGFDGSVALWDAVGGHRLATTGPAGGPAEVRFSPDGRRILATNSRGIRILDAATGRVATTLPVRAWTGVNAFAADSHRLVSWGGGGLALWDPRAPVSPLARVLPFDDANAAAFDRSGRRIATLGFSSLRLWDAATLRPLRPRLPAQDNVGLAFAGAGTLVTWSSLPPRIRLWDLTTRERRRVRAPAVSTVLATPRGLVAAGSDRHGLELLPLGRRAHTLPGSRGTSPPIAISPDGRLAVAGVAPPAGAAPGTGGGLRLWDLRSGRVLRRLPEAAADGVAFSPDGGLLATGGDDGVLRLWNGRTGRPLGTLGDAGVSPEVAFGGQGRIATLSGDTLRLWDARSRGPLASESLSPAVPGGTGDSALAFAPDGRTLIALGMGPRPLVFSAGEPAWRAAACRLLAQPLSRAEWRRYVGPGFPYRPACRG
jgi:WD40 repeat protein